jgi:hypothetical protein
LVEFYIIGLCKYIGVSLCLFQFLFQEVFFNLFDGLNNLDHTSLRIVHDTHSLPGVLIAIPIVKQQVKFSQRCYSIHNLRVVGLHNILNTHQQVHYLLADSIRLVFGQLFEYWSPLILDVFSQKDHCDISLFYIFCLILCSWKRGSSIDELIFGRLVNLEHDGLFLLAEWNQGYLWHYILHYNIVFERKRVAGYFIVNAKQRPLLVKENTLELCWITAQHKLVKPRFVGADV